MVSKYSLYGITSDIFKILMFESLGNFLGGSIVLQLEPTQKLFSRKLYNPYTVFYHTFFDLKLVYEVGLKVSFHRQLSNQPVKH